MTKSRLADILGLEEDEEYTVKGYNDIVFRIHNGERQQKDTLGRWFSTRSENGLTDLINDPSLIIHKPRFSDEEMTVLRWLHKHGKLKRLEKDIDGHVYTISDELYLAGNIADYLLKPGEEINLDEMFGGDA